MNFQPFSAISSGNLFHLVDNPSIVLMKTKEKKAILLGGYWANDQLHSRGDVVPFAADTCVVALAEGSLTLEHQKVDPIDPRRKFWNEGEFKRVGQNQSGKVNIFAGLFLYHGMGVGNYYSATANEIFWGSPSDSRERAAAEGIPFVYYDTFQWTNDPELTRERADAKRDFDKAQAKAAAAALAAKDAVSAIAETA
jgi:hypothetical protein